MSETDDSEKQHNKTAVSQLEKFFRQEDTANQLSATFSAKSELRKVLNSYQELFQNMTSTGAMMELSKNSELFNSSSLHNLTGAFGNISEELKLMQNQTAFNQLTEAFNNIESEHLAQFGQVNESLTAALTTYEMIEESKLFQQELQLHNPELDYIQHGIVDSNGNPIQQEDEEEKQIITEINTIEHELAERMKKEPEKIKDLHWREFEELIAQILERKGYRTKLTPESNDGGVDVIAAEKKDIGSFLYLVECKHWNESGPIGPKTVRELFGVVNKKGANAGIITTTSQFTDNAKKEAKDSSPYQMSLRDYEDIKEWLKEI